MKKIFTVICLATIFVLLGGTASAQTPLTAPASYTSQQQSCIKSAQQKRVAAIGVANSNLNAATSDAVKAKQDATKAASDAFSTATSSALKIEQAAVAAASKISDAKTRSDKTGAAIEAYNNDKTVKQAQSSYTLAIKNTNDAYNNDDTVKQAIPAYAAAIKAANNKFQIDQKACLSSSLSSSHKGFFSSIGEGISNLWSSLVRFFLRK